MSELEWMKEEEEEEDWGCIVMAAHLDFISRSFALSSS